MQRRAGAVFLSGGLFLATPAAAGNSDLETRVARIENMLATIVERLENGEASLSREEAAAMRQALDVVSEIDKPAALEGTTTAAMPKDTNDSRDRRPRMQPLDNGPNTPPEPPPNGFMIGSTRVALAGFIKLDATVTDFSGGSLPDGSLGRDFLIPGLIPVGGDDADAVFDTNPRETRFMVVTETPVGGLEIGSKLELDFQVTSDGNERVSNSFTPRIRQGYFTVGNWLFGQAWSTFQDVTALPENLDFIGPTEGTVFIRQPMIRYSRAGFEFAIEQPETTVTTASGGRLTPGEEFLPDLVGRYVTRGAWGHFSAAVLASALSVDADPRTGLDNDIALGIGGSLSGSFKVGKTDDIRWMANAGTGIGRYMGVNLINDAAIKKDGSLEPIPLYSGFVSYRHFWSRHWRSNLTGSVFFADHPVDLTSGAVTESAYSGHLNLIYSPVEGLDFGLEAIYARRETASGLDGAMRRLQFSSKYSF